MIASSWGFILKEHSISAAMLRVHSISAAMAEETLVFVLLLFHMSVGKGKVGGEGEQCDYGERWSSGCVPVCSCVGAPLCLSDLGPILNWQALRAGCMFPKEETGLQEKHNNTLIYIFI